MAARSHVPLRPKFFHLNTALKKDSETPTAVHGHAAEYAVGSLSVCTNAMFVVGSICFFDGWPLWVAFLGDWLFIVASVLTLLLAAWAMCESWIAHKHRDADEEEKQRDELMENFNYVVANIIFVVGSVFFMPGIYTGHDEELAGHEAGAWCFIFGSFGFVLASYWNALGMASEHGYRHAPSSAAATCVQLSKVSLCLSMVGGALFVTGSFLYRPGYTNMHGCGRSARSHSPPSSLVMQPMLKPRLSALESSSDKWPDRQGLQGLAASGMSKPQRLHRTSRRPIAALSPSEVGQPSPASLAAVGPDTLQCLNAIRDGTWLYVLGSLCFLLQSVLSLASSVIMHKSVGQQPPGGEMLKEAGGQDSGSSQA